MLLEVKIVVTFEGAVGFWKGGVGRLLGVLLMLILIWMLVTEVIMICALFCVHIMLQNKTMILKI